MNQILDVLQSATFWTAVGSIAAVCGVVAALLQGRKRKQKLSHSEQQRIAEQAGEVANRFDYWVRNYIHHGEKTDIERLIDWLEADHGYAKVAEDYQVFLKVAEVLGELGYNTRTPPTEAEFTSAVGRAKVRESRA